MCRSVALARIIHHCMGQQGSVTPDVIHLSKKWWDAYGDCGRCEECRVDMVSEKKKQRPCSGRGTFGLWFSYAAMAHAFVCVFPASLIALELPMQALARTVVVKIVHSNVVQRIFHSMLVGQKEIELTTQRRSRLKECGYES